MKKNNNALRTIGEVADLLEIEPHVIRFWEENFTNLKPIKLNNRRYYNLENISLLKQIKELLYAQDYSIKQAVEYFNSNKHPLKKIRARLEKAREKLLEAIEIEFNFIR